ncbi:UDP-N-acetylmuramoyl-tripeptide--D-alanyl-D-alanine ligase [Kineobactrum sediminis]|uniref:UDP-N-acetylmuramoyl-tripeptide--D-alanyl-D-alanine ligase n=1 Tax=Kineobactrum sediminis TaxID=1905677 RepID=A0A2N5Y3G7_9GAMM|nr:UDP-N-acetylmuramoyl-tripeptide--D-alanyl-D-alanine ligase [Kineobactrum sediminis]PLW82935.1 UDP-N-acetylmuramoyl-tripeptide--D-alanyl-D-alanine ligase [Kineobactrum sediminis]
MMRAFTLSELEKPLQARLSGADTTITRVSTDSRAIGPGDLFVALEGEHFDGHDFLEVVAAAGAAAAVVSRPVKTSLPVLQVADTQRALGYLGAYNRSLYQGQLVAITGSNGKTTVKGLVSAILARRGPTLATEGNLNNEIGVPLTLLQLAPEHAFAVVEMGAAGPGHIAWLCELARPDVALLLNAMPAHLQGFGSLEGVAAGKGEIYEGLAGAGTAIINADQPWAARWRSRAGTAAMLDYGLEHPAAISANTIQSRGVAGISFIASTPAGDAPIRLQLPGRHNVANALAAIAAGLACGLTLAEITAGLASVQPQPGRGALHRGLAGATVVDDTYNANPGSVHAAIDLLASCQGRRTLILGAMLELGADSESLHEAAGRYARERGIERFCGVGPELAGAVAAFGHGEWYADCGAAIAALADSFDERDTVLIKGSRGAAMERVLAALVQQQKEARS